jgi:hypothetical protein
MAEIAFITIVGQCLLPLALLAWLWRGICRSRVEWLLRALAVSAYLALVAVAGIWLLAPRCFLHGYVLLGLAAAAASWRRSERLRPRPAGRTQADLKTLSPLVLALFCLAMLFWALGGYTPPVGPSADLASPFKAGSFYVVNGGYSILINPHMKTLSRESLSAFRAQSYALDIVRMDRSGRRAWGLWPRDPGRYLIFGEPVYAPCAGAVANAEDGLPDRQPPSADPWHPAGNHVLLNCAEADVLLAHLMHGSLAVRPGDWVYQGQLIGKVGNSGLSAEPHLHLHAQHRGSGGDFLAAEPMPLRVDGRILVRNSQLTGSD